MPGTGRDPIAIIGIGCRYPGADGPDAFWRMLRDGVDAVGEVPPGRFDLAGVYDPRPEVPGTMHSKAGGFLERVDEFDAPFFAISPREAEHMDPQQRLLLETAHAALEDAGCRLDRVAGSRTGVFVGMCYNDYEDILFSRPDVLDLYATMGGSRFTAAGRLSHGFGLEGPSLVVDTACSSSLVAVHLACRSLREGECSLALAAGYNLILQPHVNICLEQGNVLAPDGRCKFADERADGYVRSEGVGVVVLKPLRAALADGDPIRAVILGSAVNHKGRRDGGLVSPSAASLQGVMRDAFTDAGVRPADVQYVEAHGTGTPRGDAVEIPALGAVLAEGRRPGRPCLVGSVKTNIGHSESASGIAGLIKVAMSLQHRAIPPSLHLEHLRTDVPWDDLPLEVCRRLTPWPATDGPARASFNSFGISGTNAHVVLEEAPRPSRDARAEPRPFELLVVSAKSPEALDRASANLAEHLRLDPQQALADAAYTSQAGRQPFDHRRFVVCRSSDEAAKVLHDPEAARGTLGVAASPAPPIAFLCSGVGDQYEDMTLGLYRSEPVFRDAIDRCCDVLRPLLGIDLRAALYPSLDSPGKPAPDGGIDLRRMLGRGDGRSGRLRGTTLAHCALISVEYAMAAWWRSLGVGPAALLGHSLGEYTAACLAGVFSLPDALRIVAERGLLVEKLPAGAMLGVGRSAQDVRPLLPAGAWLAADNSPATCLVSGRAEAIAALKAALGKREIPCQELDVTHAFHCPMMQPAAEALSRLIGTVEHRPPAVPFLSNVTGTRITAGEATDPVYWARHLCEPVRFAQGAAELLADPGRIGLEIGPGHALCAFAQESVPGRLLVPAVRHAWDRRPDERVLLEAVGKLWLAGVEPGWRALHGEPPPRRLHLPTYPFERQRYWIDRDEAAPRAGAGSNERLAPADWFSAVSWRQSLARPSAPPVALWILIGDPPGAVRLEARLAERGRVISFGADPAGCDAVAARLRGEREVRLVHLACLEPAASFDEAQQRGFHGLVRLAQALGNADVTGPVRLDLVTRGLFDVTGRETLSPEWATVLGPMRVIPQEYPGVTCRLIDLDPGEAVDDALFGELSLPGADPIVALRGGHRWVQAHERLEAPQGASGLLREGGVYLITGGTGGLGRALAEHLARTHRARLVLLSRSAGADAQAHATSAIEAAGGEAIAVAADVADPAALRAAVEKAERRFGPIHGVIHAAGVPGAGLIQLKTVAAAEAILAPKVGGALALAEVFAGRDLDFLAFYSTTAAIVGGLGQVDYCAANAFLDAFAVDLARRLRTRVVSIGWGPWQWDAWQATLTAAVPQMQEAMAAARAAYGITFEEGAAAFEAALSCGVPHVIVSPQDLDEMVRRHAAGIPTEIGRFLEAPARHARPALRSGYAAPAGSLEERIAGIWQEVLGIDGVGRHDDFFELGGHSLAGMRVAARLRGDFGVALPMRALFESRTVAAMAGAVEALLVAEVEAMDEAQAERWLQAHRGAGVGP